MNDGKPNPTEHGKKDPKKPGDQKPTGGQGGHPAQPPQPHNPVGHDPHVGNQPPGAKPAEHYGKVSDALKNTGRAENNYNIVKPADFKRTEGYELHPGAKKGEYDPTGAPLDAQGQYGNAPPSAGKLDVNDPNYVKAPPPGQHDDVSEETEKTDPLDHDPNNDDDVPMKRIRRDDKVRDAKAPDAKRSEAPPPPGTQEQINKTEGRSRKACYAAVGVFIFFAIAGTSVGIYVATKKDEDGNPKPVDDESKSTTRAAKDTDFDVIASNETAGKVAKGTTQTVQLLGADEMDAASVPAPSAIPVGTWTVAGTQVRFHPAGLIRDTAVPGVTVKYVLIGKDGKRSKAGTLALNFKNTPVAVDVKITATDRDGMFGELAVPPGFVSDTGSAKIDFVGMAQKTDIGTWTVDGLRIRFKPDSAFQGTTDDIKFKISNKDGTSEEATASVTLPPVGTQLPQAKIIKLPGAPRDSASEATAAEADTAANGVHLVGPNGTTDLLIVNEGTSDEGTWTVNGTKITFQPKHIVRLAPFFEQKYVLVNTAGVQSLPGSIMLTFSIIPVAAPVSVGVKTRTTDSMNPVIIDVLSTSYVNGGKAGLSKILLVDVDPSLPQTKKITGIGTFTVDTVNQQLNFVWDENATIGAVSTQYQLVDTTGAKSKFVKAEVYISMAMARALFVVDKVVPGTPLMIDVAGQSTNPAQVDRKSVVLLGPQDIGQTDVPEAVALRKDSKELVVPDEGVWAVDDSGHVSFTPSKALTQVTPVYFGLANKGGEQRSSALLVIDPGGETPKRLDKMARQSDEEFWKDFHTRIIDKPVPALEHSELLVAAQAMAAATRQMIPAGLANPFRKEGMEAAYKLWQKRGQNGKDLFTICESAAADATVGIHQPFAVRFWRLNLMVRLLTKTLIEFEQFLLEDDDGDDKDGEQ